jgi:hypothetical protein
MAKLLTRDDFRNGVFERDGHKCVFCDLPAQDAHHILERRLFSDGGYYLENGASVCGDHHLECERTTISVADVREACGITTVVVPDHMYPDHEYDKWGNHVLPNGNRTKGELFYDESVQKVLREGMVLDLFTNHVKYPRTFHLPWSGCVHSDDKVTQWLDNFVGKRVIVTEKMDGENTSLYTDYYHARSVDSRNHPSRNRAKALHSQFAYDIPYGWRICVENMFAKHSIAYDNLESYIYGFSVWDEKNNCLSWDETQEWFELLDIPSVPVLYDGIWDEDAIKALYDEKTDWDTSEGYVVRLADSFSYGEFRKCVAKYVRSEHIQTVKHWMHGQKVEPNKLKGE